MPDELPEPIAAGAPRPPLPRAKQILFAAVTALISVSLLLVAGEIGIRAYRAATKIPSPRSFIENPHGTGSYRLKPHLDAATRVAGRTIAVRTNSHGMPWREVAREKQGGVRRVAIMGDSFAQGLWAESAEKGLAGVFASIVEPGGFEVLNFGVSGYGLADVVLQIREEVLNFKPDFILLVFYAGNDIVDTYLGLERYGVADGRLVHNEAVVRAKVPPEFNPAAVPVHERHGVWDRWMRSLRPHVKLYGALRGINRRQSEPLLKEFKVRQSFTGRTFWSQKPYPPIAEQAKDVTLETLAAIAETCRENDVTLFVAALPFKEQVSSYTQRGSDFDIGRPQNFLREFCEERGIPYHDLLPAMRHYVRSNQRSVFVTDEIHLNDEGHAVAGEEMALWFRETLERLSPP